MFNYRHHFFVIMYLSILFFERDFKFYLCRNTKRKNCKIPSICVIKLFSEYYKLGITNKMNIILSQ